MMAKVGFKHTEETKRKISESEKGKYVSMETRRKLSEAHKGHSPSQKTRQKLSEANKGKTHTEEAKRKIRKANLGKHLSEETRKKMSEAKKGKIGEDCPAWKGGLSAENLLIRTSSDMIRWKKYVFERDDYTCQKCGVRNGNGKSIILNAHHIFPFAEYPEKRFDVDNGLTLCEDCHKAEHKQKSKRTADMLSAD